MQPVFREGTQRRKRLFQRVGLVGVIDEDRRARLLADEFSRPGAPRSVSSAANTLSGGTADRQRARPAATSAFSAWKAPGQRQFHADVPALENQVEQLRKAFRPHGFQPQALALFAHGEHPQAARKTGGVTRTEKSPSAATTAV